MNKKKCYIVNVNVDIPMEAYSAVGAEIKVREILYSLDCDINRIYVTEEDEDEQKD